MEFKDFAESIQQQLLKMASLKLFRSSVSGQDLWDAYLNNFKDGDNPTFRDPESSQHNDNLDRSFIKRYGNIVALDANFDIVTMFDIMLGEDSIYYGPVTAMNDLLKNNPIGEVFFETLDTLKGLPYEKIKPGQTQYKLGFVSTPKMYTQEEADKFGVVTPGIVYTFYHFNGIIPERYVSDTNSSVEALMAGYRDDKNVFKRGLDEISLGALEIAVDLITQNSILNGQSYLPKLERFISAKREYDKVPAEKMDNWAWNKSYDFPYSKFRNELIGTLCVDISTGVSLEKACLDWNKRADPANYMKATAPITKKQIQEAEQFVAEAGLEDSFNRRYATVEDINIAEILHVNNASQAVKSASLFGSVKPTIPASNTKDQLAHAKEVSIDKFMEELLPHCTSVEAYLENRFKNNLVTLTTSVNKESKPIFKWSNNYSWTYEGNLAGKSMIKSAVKDAGGFVDGVLRFSIIWNEDGKDILDFDAHATEPSKNHIYFGNHNINSGYRPSKIGGRIDVDMINPKGLGVENITWDDKSKMADGVYKFWIHNFNNGSNTGFKAQIEFDGNIYNYEYNGRAMNSIDIATVTLKKGVFTIDHKMKSTDSVVPMWGINSNEFHKVNLMCLSPNYWGDNNIGNKHYFFLLDKCHSDKAMRSFHVENLSSELLLHRKVMEVLGESTKLSPADEQLAGLGFNATVPDELIARICLHGTTRVIKIKF